MRDDQEMIDFLQRAIGYTLTGDVSEQCLFFLYGHGRNGKSTFVETMLKLLDEYAIKAATNDLARLYGMRAVVAKETDEGQRLAEAVIKDLTGGAKNTEEMDVLGEFLQECCGTAPDGRLTAALLYTEYSAWCARMGEQPISKRALGLRMKERGFTQYRDGTARMWEGLKLRSESETIPV